MGGVAPPAAPVGARSPCRAAQRRGCAAGAACPRSGYGTGSARMRRQGGWGARAGTASAPRSRWGNGGISAVVLARSGLGAAVARCSGIAARMGARPWGFLGFWGWLRGGGPCTFRVALCAFAPSPPRPLSFRAAAALPPLPLRSLSAPARLAHRTPPALPPHPCRPRAVPAPRARRTRGASAPLCGTAGGARPNGGRGGSNPPQTKKPPADPAKILRGVTCRLVSPYLRCKEQLLANTLVCLKGSMDICPLHSIGSRLYMPRCMPYLIACLCSWL